MSYPWPADISVNSNAGVATVGCRDFIHTRHHQASYRNIPFMVDRDDWVGGRRNVTHQFPSSERWLNEDLGQRAVGVSVAGYVYGDRVEEWAHMLFEACSNAGEAELFLPMRPKMRARCNECRIDWNADKQGRMDCTMEFVLENRPTIADFPWAPPLAAAQVDAKSQAMTACARATILNVVAQARPSSAYAAAATEIKTIGYRLRQIVQETPLPAVMASRVTQTGLTMRREATAFAYGLRQRADELRPTAFGGGQEQAVVYTARHDYVYAVDTAIQLLRAGAKTQGSQELLSRGLVRWASMRPLTQEADATIPSAIAVQQLVDVVVQYARWLAIAAQVVLLTDAPESLESSLEITKRVQEQLIAELEEAAAFPDMQDALQSLLSSWMRYLDVVRRSTARQVVVPWSGPIAPVAANLYGGTEVKEVEHDRQLVLRNSLRHPLFVFQDVNAAVEPSR